MNECMLFCHRDVLGDLSLEHALHTMLVAMDTHRKIPWRPKEPSSVLLLVAAKP
jgi:hypothetical protein